MRTAFKISKLGELLAGIVEGTDDDLLEDDDMDDAGVGVAVDDEGALVESEVGVGAFLLVCDGGFVGGIEIFYFCFEVKDELMISLCAYTRRSAIFLFDTTDRILF